ncbi:MAG: hydroxymethylglutaryl-CoA synthase, partial [Flavobacteriaceae bacterium]|nr:hydroxymethylglutaryl-CoA synthase [Flavobacteriaceae bacterium]
SKAKIFEGTIESTWKNKIKNSGLFDALEERKEVDVSTYEKLHKNIITTPVSKSINKIKLSSIQNGEFTRGLRTYKLL